MLDYKNIIIKRYALNLSFRELAEEFGASRSGVNDFIRAFEKCEKLSYPLPEGITNYAIAELVYGHTPGSMQTAVFSGHSGLFLRPVWAIFRGQLLATQRSEFCSAR